ncbi:hypothetical protein ACQKEM_07120 [Pseudomonas sp. NPDC077382]
MSTQPHILPYPQTDADLTINPYSFFREDALTSIIRHKIRSHLGKQVKKEGFLEKIVFYSNNKNWIELTAVSYAMACSFPEVKNGYLSFLDGLLKLDLLEDFLRFIQRIPLSIVDQTNISRRVVQYYWQTKRFDKCIEACQSHPGDKFHTGRGFNASIITNNYKQASLFLKSGLINENKEYLSSKISQWSALEKEYENCGTEEDYYDKLCSHLSHNRFKEANAGFWICLSKDKLNDNILQRAVKPFTFEHPISNKISLFSAISYEKHQSEWSTFSQAHIDCLIYNGGLDEAYKILASFWRKNSLKGPYVKKLEMIRRAIRPYDTPFLNIIYGREAYQGEEVIAANYYKWHNKPEAQEILENTLDYLKKSKISQNFVSNACADRPSKLKAEHKKSPLKVAVCLSGQLRSFRKNAPHIWKNFVTPFDSDVFIHTWEKQVYAPSEIKSLTRVIGNDLCKLLPLDLQGGLEFEKSFPATASLLSSEQSFPVNESELKSLPGVVDVRIDNSSEFERSIYSKKGIWFANKPNQAKMFYKIQACDELRTQHEKSLNFEYDVVIRIRPDLHIEIPCLSDFLHEAAGSPSTLFTSYFHQDGYGDQFAAGSSLSMQAYSSAWQYLEKYGRFDYIEGFSGRAAEALMGDHLLACGLDVQLIHSSERKLRNDLPIEYLDIRAPLMEDLKNIKRDDLKDFINAINIHYLESKSS